MGRKNIIITNNKMATYKVDWVENKNPDWKVATLVGADGYKTEDVSINRANKKGEVFPNFDGILPGSDVEGELWQSNASKWYLFAPKAPKSASGGGFKGNMEKVMERKESGIRLSQENKEHGIKVASTMNGAVQIAVAMIKDDKTVIWTDDLVKKEVKKWREFLWLSWDAQDTDFPPVA